MFPDLLFTKTDWITLSNGFKSSIFDIKKIK